MNGTYFRNLENWVTNPYSFPNELLEVVGICVDCLVRNVDSQMEEDQINQKVTEMDRMRQSVEKALYLIKVELNSVPSLLDVVVETSGSFDKSIHVIHNLRYIRKL